MAQGYTVGADGRVQPQVPQPVTPQGNTAPPGTSPGGYDAWLAGWDPSQMPAYGSSTDASGNLLPQYKVNAGAPVQFSGDIQNQPWMQMLQKQNDTQTMQQLDALNSTNNSQTAMGISNLASHGGASAGAMTNLQTAAAKNAVTGSQGVRAQGAWNGLNLLNQGVQEQANLDTSNRQYQTGVDQTNAATALQNLQGQNQYNLGKYNTQAAAWGADKTAYAQEHSGKKG